MSYFDSLRLESPRVFVNLGSRAIEVTGLP